MVAFDLLPPLDLFDVDEWESFTQPILAGVGETLQGLGTQTHLLPENKGTHTVTLKKRGKGTLVSLNYIKQLGLKDTLHWTPLFSEETLHTHKYDIPLERVGHL